ncbi:MAG: hypothetical protein A2096_04695 [Spirochaetes bacterium GWF1_41_5]|nr:MAG: hypothetical protein A2096_04695 [Spirochaetes bacterium GWF1_41_5]
MFFEKPSSNNFYQIQKELVKTSKIDIKKLSQIYLKSPCITQEKLMDIVNQINLLADYIIEINKKNELLQKLRKTYAYSDISKTVNFKNRQEAVIKRAIDFVTENYTKRITLEDVSRIVFISPDYLSHLFKKVTGKSFTGIINDLRIEKAKNLLKNPLVNIKNIASELGFSNPYYFSRFFSSKVKISPFIFRAKKY